MKCRGIHSGVNIFIAGVTDFHSYFGSMFTPIAACPPRPPEQEPFDVRIPLSTRS